jgi:hypothetical protein
MLGKNVKLYSCCSKTKITISGKLGNISSNPTNENVKNYFLSKFCTHAFFIFNYSLLIGKTVFLRFFEFSQHSDIG